VRSEAFRSPTVTEFMRIVRRTSPPWVYPYFGGEVAVGRFLRAGLGESPELLYRCDSCTVEVVCLPEDGPAGWAAGWVRTLPERRGMEALRRVDLCALCAARTPLAAWDGGTPRPLTPLRAEAGELFRALAENMPPAELPSEGSTGLRGWLRRLAGR
jgi:hypothetical protein